MSAPLWVVKIGGSLAHGAETVRPWLSAVRAGRGRVVVVPGGGPFADAVRASQPVLGFDDHAAHRMALLAMEQYGIALAAMAEGFVSAATPADLVALTARGCVPVWAPVTMALGAPDIPESWDVTSDSLAAWLARLLGASRLVLVKSAPRPGGGMPLAAAIRAGLVDRAFDAFATGGFDVVCLGPGDHDRLAAALAGGHDLPGRLALDSDALVSGAPGPGAVTPRPARAAALC